MENNNTYQYYREKNKEKLKCMKPEIAGKYLGVFDYLYKTYGIVLLYYSVCRSFEEQWELRKKYLMGTGSRATKVGASWHNWGRAVDAVPIEGGKANWKSKNWDKIEKAFNAVGINSGKDYGDQNHFEYTKGTTLTHERATNPGWRKYEQMEKQMFPNPKDDEILLPPSDYATGFVRNRKKFLIPAVIVGTIGAALTIDYVRKKKKKKRR